MQFLKGRPEMDYPCPWQFKVIGREEARIRDAIDEIVGDHAHTVTLSNHSAKGNYCSLNLEMVVVDASHRIGTYTALMEHRSIQLVL